jgi:hypothetical protein
MPEKKQILFGGLGVLPARVAEFKSPQPGDRPKWVEVLEQAFVQLTATDEGKQLYGDPEKGGTVEQAWRTNGLLTGKLPVCLLSTDQPPVTTDAIDRVIKMKSPEVVETLVDLFGTEERVAFPILYHDGHMGHSVTLLAFDAGRFTYHDPWPGDSLLTKDYNAAGVAAQAKNGSWSITTAELEKVIFAAFVPSALWAEYQGEQYFMTYDEFSASDFWKFFHIKEAARHDEDGQTSVTLKPGGFQSEIAMSVALNEKNRLTAGLLRVKRSWVVGPPHGMNPLALDLVRSFIRTLTPPPDQDQVSGLVNMLRQIQNPTYANQLVEEGPDKSFEHLALFTYLGPSPSCEAVFPYSKLSLKNVTDDGTDWLETQITTDAL